MLDSGERRALVTTLGRLCTRDPRKAPLLVDALLGQPEALGPDVLEIALELGMPVVSAIETALADPHREREADELADALEQHLPWPTVALRQVAVNVVTRVLRKKEVHDVRYVERLISLSSRLADAGQQQEAIAASEQALAIVDADPSLGLDMERVAGLLINRIVQMHACDQFPDADVLVERALNIFSGIEEGEQQPWFREHLARLLSTGALVAFKLGRADEAIGSTRKAIEIFEALVVDGQLSFRVELSRTLGNLASFLDANDMSVEAYELAQRSVALSRRLVESEPDRGLPELAMSLEQLAGRARLLQKAEDALEASAEAVKIYEQLTRSRLSSFARRLASSLGNHTVYLVEAGEGEDPERLGHARRAVEILEAYASENEGAVREELGIACMMYAEVLLEVERSEEAVIRLHDALRYLRRCRSPGAKLRRVVVATNLVQAFIEAGRLTAADRMRRRVIAHLDTLSPEEINAIPGVAEAIRHQIET